MHLLLSSQRIEGGKLKGLDTYLSYRLGLRTFSADESRTVLDTTDAFHLPPLPGFGYLKVDTTIYQRLQGGLRLRRATAGTQQTEPARTRTSRCRCPGLRLCQHAARRSTPPGASPARGHRQPTERATGPTVMSALVETMSDFPRVTAPIWLPPLPHALDPGPGRGPGAR